MKDDTYTPYFHDPNAQAEMAALREQAAIPAAPQQRVSPPLSRAGQVGVSLFAVGQLVVGVVFWVACIVYFSLKAFVGAVFGAGDWFFQGVVIDMVAILCIPLHILACVWLCRWSDRQDTYRPWEETL